MLMIAVAVRNGFIVRKERRIGRIPSGYSVREFHDDAQGRYWYVVAALELMAANQRADRTVSADV